MSPRPSRARSPAGRPWCAECAWTVTTGDSTHSLTPRFPPTFRLSFHRLADAAWNLRSPALSPRSGRKARTPKQPSSGGRRAMLTSLCVVVWASCPRQKPQNDGQGHKPQLDGSPGPRAEFNFLIHCSPRRAFTHMYDTLKIQKEILKPIDRA